VSSSNESTIGGKVKVNDRGRTISFLERIRKSSQFPFVVFVDVVFVGLGREGGAVGEGHG